MTDLVHEGSASVYLGFGRRPKSFEAKYQNNKLWESSNESPQLVVRAKYIFMPAIEDNQPLCIFKQLHDFQNRTFDLSQLLPMNSMIEFGRTHASFLTRMKKVKAPINNQFAIAKIYENEFSQIGFTLLTRALLCAGLMALVASGVALLAGN